MEYDARGSVYQISETAASSLFMNRGKSRTECAHIRWEALIPPHVQLPWPDRSFLLYLFLNTWRKSSSLSPMDNKSRKGV